MNNLLATHQHKRRIRSTTWLVFARDMQRYYVFINVNFTHLNFLSILMSNTHVQKQLVLPLLIGKQAYLYTECFYCYRI